MDDVVERLHAELEQARSVEETTHGLYKFWNGKAAELAASNDELRADIARLSADLEEARKALEPFARYETADGLPCGFLRVPDEHPILFNGLGDEVKVVATVGDLRRAAAIRKEGERT